MTGRELPIGVFDSGVGGLSVLKSIRSLLPEESVLFLADQLHVPYGPRPIAQVREFAESITRFLLDQGVKLVVVACNTASAAALIHLRQTFPDIPFVGMEPAVKPAAEKTETGVVGVLATPATFQGALYASVLERFAQGVHVLQDTCPGLVEQIENGALNGTKTRGILEKALQPMLSHKIDTVVLGCTHYPFVISLIEEISGPGVRVIDPSPAVARQVKRVLLERNLQNPGVYKSFKFFTTSRPSQLTNLLPVLLGETGEVVALRWKSENFLQKERI